MRVLQAIREKPLHAILSAVGIFILVPIVQLISTPLAFDIWYRTLQERPINTILYLAFSVFFGMLISLYIYAKDRCLDCSPNGASAGVGGATLGFIVGVCPACFSLIGVLLPLSGSIFLTAYAPLFTALSIGIVLFSIYQLGGFKRDTAMPLSA